MPKRLEKPTALSATWWKKNKPKDLKNSKVEPILRIIENNPTKDVYSELIGVTEGTDLGSMENETLTPRRDQLRDLLEELKRAKNVLDKNECAEFMECIDELIEIARKERQEFEQGVSLIKKKFQKSKAEQQDKARKLEAIAERYKKQEYADRGSVSDILKDIKSGGNKAATSEAYKDVFSNIKGITAWIKKKIVESKKDFAKVKSESEGISELLDKKTILIIRSALGHIEELTILWAQSRDSARKIDLGVLQQAVQDLGKAEAIQVYMQSDATEPNGLPPLLRRPLAKELKLQIKKQ